MRWLDPIPCLIWGAHIDRDTVSHVDAAGFDAISVRNLSHDIVRQVACVSP